MNPVKVRMGVTIWQVTSGNGVTIGINRVTMPVHQRVIRRDRQRGLINCCVAVVGTAISTFVGRRFVATATTAHHLTVTAPSVFVVLNHHKLLEKQVDLAEILTSGEVILF